MANIPANYPTTPDGRYFVVRGRVWRCSNPNLPEDERQRLVDALMQARRVKGVAMRMDDPVARAAAKSKIDGIKQALGERGEVWWSDNSPDYNRYLVKNTPYAAWFEDLRVRGANDAESPKLPK